jgi:pimeloyl-ACP methyl ester carboxylesterase
LAEAWPEAAKVPQLVALLPWGHLRVLLDRLKDRDIREWYLRAAIKYGWSRDMLVHQISSGLPLRRAIGAEPLSADHTRHLGHPDPLLQRQPVLFINGDFDGLCDITHNRLGEPMRSACQDLAVTNLPSGHWLPLERKAEVIQAVRSWLKTKTL